MLFVKSFLTEVCGRKEWQMIKKNTSIANILITLILLIFTILCILPFWYVFITSISDPQKAAVGDIRLFPNGFSLKSYNIVLTERKFYNGLLITVTRTLVGTSLGLLIQCAAAYVLSRSYLMGRKILIKIVIFTILFNGGIIPTYLVIQNLHLLNTIWALIFPMIFNPWNVLLLISFFSSIPDSIEESAKLEGANDILIFFKLAIPLAKSAVMTIMLYIAVRHWNELMDGILYINSDFLKPLQVYLIELIMRSSIQNMIEPSENYVTALSIQTTVLFISSIPILIVYPIVQKYFVKGIMIGGVKG